MIFEEGQELIFFPDSRVAGLLEGFHFLSVRPSIRPSKAFLVFYRAQLIAAQSLGIG